MPSKNKKKSTNNFIPCKLYPHCDQPAISKGYCLVHSIQNGIASRGRRAAQKGQIFEAWLAYFGGQAIDTLNNQIKLNNGKFKEIPLLSTLC